MLTLAVSCLVLGAALMLVGVLYLIRKQPENTDAFISYVRSK